jgi:hypothetical protein
MEFGRSGACRFRYDPLDVLYLKIDPAGYQPAGSGDDDRSVTRLGYNRRDG